MKITNSLTLKHLYRTRLRAMLQDKGIYIQESDIHKIVRERNKEMVERLLKAQDIELPYRLGVLGLRKKKIVPRMKDGKLIGLPPINWKKTKETGVRVYSDYRVLYKIILMKKGSSNHVKFFWRFRFTSSVNKRIYELATTNPNFDALEYVRTRKSSDR